MQLTWQQGNTSVTCKARFILLAQLNVRLVGLAFQQGRDCTICMSAWLNSYYLLCNKAILLLLAIPYLCHLHCSQARIVLHKWQQGQTCAKCIAARLDSYYLHDIKAGLYYLLGSKTGLVLLAWQQDRTRTFLLGSKARLVLLAWQQDRTRTFLLGSKARLVLLAWQQSHV